MNDLAHSPYFHSSLHNQFLTKVYDIRLVGELETEDLRHGSQEVIIKVRYITWEAGFLLLLLLLVWLSQISMSKY